MGCICAARPFMHSVMLMKRAFAQIPHCAFFFSEDLGILLGSPCGSGTDLGVLANISSFLQVLSLDPLQVVTELKPCSHGCCWSPLKIDQSSPLYKHPGNLLQSKRHLLSSALGSGKLMNGHPNPRWSSKQQITKHI